MQFQSGNSSPKHFDDPSAECEVLNAKDGNSESKLIAKYDILHAAACLEEGLKFRSMDRVLSREAQNLNEDALKPLTWSYEADRQRLLAIQQAVREGKPASRTKTSEIDLPGLPSLLENATRKLGQMFEQSLCFVDIAIAKAEAVKIGQKTPASISSRLVSSQLSIAAVLCTVLTESFTGL